MPALFRFVVVKPALAGAGALGVDQHAHRGEDRRVEDVDAGMLGELFVLNRNLIFLQKGI